MATSEARAVRWRPVVLFVLAHALAFGVLAWLAHTSSADRPDLSAQGSHMRLIPLDSQDER